MGLLSIAKRCVTWWDGMTLNTQINSLLYGCYVGQDDAGNRFYRNRTDTRRWVLFNGEADASRVPPDWHGWLHHTWPKPPTLSPPPQKGWEKEHQPNLTGSDRAYAPPGSLCYATPKRPCDYEAWKPE